jgi:hypothetical protein
VTVLDAFMDDARQVTTLDIVRRVGSIRPTSVVKREEIGELRRWAQDHLAVDAGQRQPAGGGERLLEL